ncbi:MAG: hypothetical protein M0P69_21140 [Bacteroidales bacterium]|nr:hypothetical protein [Bacteroidales bacterium]
MYGSIGFTRGTKAPPHWRDDYRLTLKARKAIRALKTEKERLFRQFEALPDAMPDSEYNQAERRLRRKLDALMEREDGIRKTNLR